MPDDPVKPELVETEPSAPVASEPSSEEAHLSIGPMIDGGVEGEGAEEMVAPVTRTPSAPGSQAPAVPAPAPSPVTVPSVAAPSAVDTSMQQRLQALEEQLARQHAETQEKADIELLNTWTANRQAELEEQDGLTPESARKFAQGEAQRAYQGYKEKTAFQNQVVDAQAKVLVAGVIADHFKVPVVSLLQASSPQAMITMATEIQNQSSLKARVAALEKENADLKQSKVPPQKFDNNRAGAVSSGNRQNLLERYISGEKLPEKVVKGLFQEE